MQKYSDVVTGNLNGVLRALSNASVLVTVNGTGTPATLYSTPGISKSNPTTTDANGRVEFYAADGRYDLTVTASGYGVVTVSDVILEDPSDAAITGGTINATSIGATTPSTGAFTTLTTTGNVTLGDASTDTVTVNGYMGVGGAGDATVAVRAINSGVSTGFRSAVTSPTSGSGNFIGYTAAMAVPAGTYTATTLRAYNVNDTTVGAGSTISAQYGLYVNDLTTGTNNYGIASLVSSGSNKWNIYASGTAANYFAGNVGLGVTPSAWGSGYRAFDLFGTGLANSTTGGQTNLAQNAYHNGTNWVYKYTAAATLYQSITGQHLWSTAASDTAGNTVTFTQSLAVGLGTTLALEGATSAAGTGIAFPATQLASTNANTLDDYREGTFTPTIVGTSTAGVGTYSNQVGRYTKIGNRVFFNLYVSWTAHTGTGNMVVGALPFTSVNVTAAWNSCDIQSANLTYTNDLVAQIQNNATQIVIQTQASAAAPVALALDTSAWVNISGHYEV